MKRLLFLAAALAVVWPSTAQHRSDRVGIALRAGTLGPGIDLGIPITERLSLRLSGSYLRYTATDDSFIDDDDLTVALTADATVGAASVRADLHPWDSAFRLTGGVSLHLFDVDADGLPTSSVCFGDLDAAGVCSGKELSPDRLGTIHATATYPSPVAPYVGFGFGRVSGHRRVGLLVDVGGLYRGSPVIELESTDLLSPTAEANEQNLNEGVESFRWYPVVSLGLALRL